MAKPRRPRRAHPYLWSTIAALVAVAWVGSYWVWMLVTYHGALQQHACSLTGGCIDVARAEWKKPQAPWGWQAKVDVGPEAWALPRAWWWPGRDQAVVGQVEISQVTLPLWPFVAGAAAFAAIHWRRALRHPPNACPACGYPRAGLNPDAPCPECGQGLQPSDANA